MIRLSPISRPSDLPVLNPLAELKPEPASPPGGPAELPLARGRERSAGSGEPGRSMPRLSASRTTGPIARSARRAALLLVAVLGTALPAAAATEVPSDWSLIPTGLSTGDQFRLLFLSSTKRNASSTDIATYNTFIQGRAAAGHADIQTYSTGFRAVGCTADTDARDNTSTTYTTTDKGVPIYWLNGAKVADQYEDFYDGSWDDEANDKNESGTNGPDTSLRVNYPWTGCDHDGTEAVPGGDSFALGSNLSDARVGRPNSDVTNTGPLNGQTNRSHFENDPMYGLSAVFQVAADTTPPTLTSAEVDDDLGGPASGLIINLDFSEDLQLSNPPPASAFTVTVDGSAATISSVLVPGSALPQNRLWLQLSTAITHGQAVVVAYADPTTGDDANAIQDAAGNDAAAFTTGMHGVPAVTNATTGAPGAPTGLTATASGTTAINLSWTAPASTGGRAITGYKIESSSDGGSSWTDLVANTSNTTTTYAHTGLTAGDTRHYRVSAINTNGTGAPSNVDSATAGATAPGAPTGLTATASGTTAINLSWTAPGSTGGSAITGYKIESSSDGGSSWTDQVANTSNTTTTYAHTGLMAGDTRHYRVSAINTNGTGAPSNVDSATTATSAPGAPTGLTATASGTTAINLSWTAPGSTGGSAITGYKIEVAPDGTSWTDQVANTSNTTTTYAHTGLMAGDTRHYRVSAINTNGTGAPSNVDSATTATSAPGAPTGLTATASGTTAINLSWTAPGSTGGSAITGYKIEVAPDGTSWTDQVANTSNTTTTYAHTGLMAGDTRHYRVSAINTNGTGTASNVDATAPGAPTGLTATASATTDATAPGAPTDLTATASGTTAINLSWTAPGSTGGSAITGYKIEVAPDGTSWTDQVANTSNTTTTYAHTGLMAGDTRHYRVSAINTNGTGTASNVDSATTDATAPGAPTGLTATASGATQIDLSWTAPGSTGGSAITGYKIEVSPDTTSWTDQVANTSNTTTTYAHTGLMAGDTRHYRVSAINTNGTGEPSNVDSATTTTSAPGAPTGLTATASGATQIDLSWTAPGSTGGSAITGYKIEVAPDTTSWTDLVANTGNTTTTYAHTGLTAGETRHYRVSAINTNGTGEPSNVDSATTTTSAPGAPTGLTATASGTTAIDLSWTAPGSTGGSAITGYKIEVSPDGTSWTDQVANTSNTTTTYAHTGLMAGDTRHYRVSAINTNGTGEPSNVDSATTTTSAPGAPTGLTATASGATQIDLSWTAPGSTGGSAITGYKIEVAPDTTSWTDLVANTGNADTTYAHTGLTAGETRHYRVSAINTNGTGEPSNVDSATTTATSAPGAPTGLTATASGTTQIDLSWTAPGSTGGSAITGYKIEVSPDTTSWTDQVANTSNTTTTYAHTGLTAGDTRHYRVSAINTNGTGDPSNVDSATTAATSAPGAPTGLTATASGTTAIDLSWTAPGSTGGSAITGYKIEVSPAGTDGWTDQVADTSNTTTTYAHTGLTAGDTRHYRVSAINTNGTGAPSNVDSATTTTTATSAPGAPTGLTAIPMLGGWPMLLMGALMLLIAAWRLRMQ